MNIYIRKIRQFAKNFILYTIEGEYKVYRLKGAPFQIRIPYTAYYHKYLEKLPVQEKKIIFDNYMGKSYGCNPKYVTEELLKRNEDFDIVWTVKNASEKRGEFPKKVRLVEYGSKEAMEEYATAKVWIGNYHLVSYLNQGLLKKTKQHYIQMWHGSFGIKKIEGDCKNLTLDKNWTHLAQKNSQYTDYWISNGSFETCVYQQAFWDVEGILELGHPRNDIFFHGKADKARTAVESFIKRKNCKLLLYVPTFRDDVMEWEQPINYKQLKSGLEQRFGGEWLILLRMHPRMKEFASKLIPKEEYCVDVTDYADVQELLAAADAVITDYSSAIFDYLLTKKPSFIYAPDYENYKEMRGLYYPLEETPFSIAGDNETLAKNIAAFSKTEYEEKVESFLKEKGSAEQGNAAEKVADLIQTCID